MVSLSFWAKRVEENRAAKEFMSGGASFKANRVLVLVCSNLVRRRMEDDRCMLGLWKELEAEINGASDPN